MTDRGADVFLRFLRHAFRQATLGKATLELIVSEPYHDERVPAVQTFTPWLAGAALLLGYRLCCTDRANYSQQFPRRAGLLAG